MKRLRNILLVLLIIVGGYFILRRLQVIPSLNIFKSQPVVIDQTPILIKQIRQIGQLITYTSYDEVVANSSTETRGSGFVKAFNRLVLIPVLPSADKQLVLIGRGRVLAGVNLDQLKDSALLIKNDTVFLYLPRPIILDAIVNPSGFETFVEKGKWNETEVNQVKLKVRNKIIQRAVQHQIISKAARQAKNVMGTFLHNLGYQTVVVGFDKS